MHVCVYVRGEMDGEGGEERMGRERRVGKGRENSSFSCCCDERLGWSVLKEGRLSIWSIGVRKEVGTCCHGFTQLPLEPEGSITSRPTPRNSLCSGGHSPKGSPVFQDHGMICGHVGQTGARWQPFGEVVILQGAGNIRDEPRTFALWNKLLPFKASINRCVRASQNSVEPDRSPEGSNTEHFNNKVNNIAPNHSLMYKINIHKSHWHKWLNR